MLTISKHIFIEQVFDDMYKINNSVYKQEIAIEFVIITVIFI